MSAPYGGYPGYANPSSAPGYQPAGAGAPPGYGQQPVGAPGGYGAPPQQGSWAPPGVSPDVLQWFHAVDADRSGHISSIELQQALTNANWSHFNAETCRLMVGMFDRDHSGKIDINEFQALWNYIHQWKGVFDRYDRDRSGMIDANEFHSAISEMGYRVTPQFAQLVVYRYDPQARQRLSLDNFIQSCVLLKSVTDTFRQKDVQGQGSIRVSYEEFLTMVVLNKG